MKAFARHRNTKSPSDDVTTDHDDLTDADAPHDEHADPSMGDDFLQRLGDLDQFIGAATTAPIGQTAPTITRFPTTATPLRNGDGTTAPAAALPVVPPATRRLFDARTNLPLEAGEATSNTVDSSEADDFIQRLGDLDRFIGGPAAPVEPVATTDSTTDTTEADDFLQRLGDLDRFIGGSDS